MSWIQILLETSSDNVEILEELLLKMGACSVTLMDSSDQPLYEPEPGSTPLWDKTTVIGLFTADIATDTLLAALEKEARDFYFSHKIEAVEDKDWEREWIKHFKPMLFGKRLWICPSWSEPPVPEAVNLMLDPGMAFGTGTHSTTALCLQWLDGYDVTNKIVLDYGCGSGVLGIASCLLGAEKVFGVDIDPQALRATKDNSSRNRIDSSRLEVFLPDDIPGVYADLTIANILASPLKKLVEKLARSTVIGGTIILSGLIESQISDVQLCYEPYFEMKQPVIKDGWVLLEGLRTQ